MSQSKYNASEPDTGAASTWDTHVMLARQWLLPLIPDLAARSEAYRTDFGGMGDGLLHAFLQQIDLAAQGIGKAIAQADELGIRRHAHTLQGMGGTVGLPEISVLGDILGTAARAGDFAHCRALLHALIGWRDTSQAPSGGRPDTSGWPHGLPSLQGDILVVDDEAPNRDYLCRLLTACGANVMTADNGERALEIVRCRHPDLALVDVVMPGISGYEVCARLAASADAAGTTVIMVTARTSAEDVEHAFLQGAFDYIRKPFHNRELLARVGNALQLKRKSDAMQNWNLRISRELEIAGALQAKLFSPVPRPGKDYDVMMAYQPSQQIGGDMFDIHELPDGRLMAYVADVCGHGVASALVSALLKALISDVAFGFGSAQMPLYLLMNEIHIRFCKSVPDPELYATLLMIRLDPETRLMEMISCGHPEPLLYDEHGVRQALQTDGAGGMPIGVMPPGLQSAYGPGDEVVVGLPERPSVFLYTDGVTEARRPDGTACGTEGLEEAIRAARYRTNSAVPPDRVLEKLAEAGYRVDADDCSLLCLHLHAPQDLLDSTEYDLASVEDAERIAGLIHDRLLADGWEPDSALFARLLATEHNVNIVRHGRLPAGAKCHLRLCRTPDGCTILFRDPGMPWNLCAEMRKRAASPSSDTQENGRGLQMIWSIMRRIWSFRRDNSNYALYELDAGVAKRLSATLAGDGTPGSGRDAAHDGGSLT